MQEVAEGYNVALDYNYGYFPELNPLRMRLSLLNSGFVAPTVGTACELGFGQGISANLHSAGSAVHWYGTDFSPSQAGFAQELAAASGSVASFYDQPFAEFCRRTDLPDFDFIGLHGIWSWVSDQNREVIRDFISRKLKVGGVLYVSYNAMPANAAIVPVRDVLFRYAESMRRPGIPLAAAVESALEFAQKLLAASPGFAGSAAGVANRLQSIRNEDRLYVTHEYFNPDWKLTSFAEMAGYLSGAKLQFACSANYFKTVNVWNLSAEQTALLAEVPDEGLRETVRDVLINERFRKDYWIKGARRLTELEKMQALREQRVMLILPRPIVDIKAEGARGIFAPPKAFGDGLLNALGDYRPKTLAELEQALKHHGAHFSKIVELVMTLMQTNCLAPVQEQADVAAAKPQTDRLNAFLCGKARHRISACVLASPVTGGGLVQGSRTLQYFWHGMKQGKTQAADLAAHAAQIFGTPGMTLLQDEAAFMCSGGPSDLLNSEAKLFAEGFVPLFKALQIL